MSDGREADDRLFAPLNTKPFRQFESGDKKWELRGVNDRFNRDTVYKGRAVELRRGYNTGDSIWGWITDVRTFKSLETLVEALDYKEISPDVDSEEEFIKRIEEEVFEDQDYDEYIAFEVGP